MKSLNFRPCPPKSPASVRSIKRLDFKFPRPSLPVVVRRAWYPTPGHFRPGEPFGTRVRYVVLA